MSPAAAIGAEVPAAQSSGLPTSEEEIIIFGRRLVDVVPERELDEQGISSYAQSTIDELLAEVQGELGDDEQPLILVNGQRVGDLDEIGGLPVEALSNVKILPRGSAVRAGGTPGQRVVNLTLKKKLLSATLLAAPKVATDGDWHGERGEATLTYIRDSTRANLGFKARQESDLLETDRGIIQPEPTPAFALGGNVVGFPDTGGEIDPLLSAAAGEEVTVAAIPASGDPSLLDFAANANEAAVTDVGRFRTLRPKTRNYDLNGTATTRLTPWLTGTVGFRLGHSTRRSLRGLPSTLFVLAPTNPASPFSTSVALAEYGVRPLHTRSERDSGEATITLNGRFGKWTSFFNARHFESTDQTRTERRASLGTIVLTDNFDPFAEDPFDLVQLRTDRAKARTHTTQARLSFTGPLVNLPAGDVQATLEGQYAGNRLRSRSDTALLSETRSFHRDETALRGAVDVPLTSHDGFGAAIGDLGVSGDFRHVHYSDAGNAFNYRLGAAWDPRPILHLSADLEDSRLPASVQVLGNPLIVTPGIRTFDPLRGETVDVTQITGGNPDLRPERTTRRRVTALVRLVERLNLELNAEYADRKERNFVSSLPEASAAVMLAFPERFVRDSNGTLTTVDLRPVNFDSHRERWVRYGFSINTRLGGSRPPVRAAVASASMSQSAEDDEDRAARVRPVGRSGPRTRLQLTGNHTIVFSDTIVIRPGLDRVNLLEGGAIGIGGGRVRHQLDGTAAVTSGGSGLRATVSWRGKSTLESRVGTVTDRLRFSPLLLVNFRAFADAGRLFGRNDWTKGMRVSLNVLNATNDRQKVRDSFGNTPLQYQPGYRDPIGRTIELELRKVF